jgi:dual oxidase
LYFLTYYAIFEPALPEQLYIILYLLNLVHGMARITQPPKFYAFFLGPAVLYALDKIISLRR